jgi:hypothetical protein
MEQLPAKAKSFNPYYALIPVMRRAYPDGETELSPLIRGRQKCGATERDTAASNGLDHFHYFVSNRAYGR